MGSDRLPWHCCCATSYRQTKPRKPPTRRTELAMSFRSAMIDHQAGGYEVAVGRRAGGNPSAFSAPSLPWRSGRKRARRPCVRLWTYRRTRLGGEHDLDDPDDYGGNSQSFIEGCQRTPRSRKTRIRIPKMAATVTSRTSVSRSRMILTARWR